MGENNRSNIGNSDDDDDVDDDDDDDDDIIIKRRVRPLRDEEKVYPGIELVTRGCGKAALEVEEADTDDVRPSSLTIESSIEQRRRDLAHIVELLGNLKRFSEITNAPGHAHRRYTDAAQQYTYENDVEVSAIYSDAGCLGSAGDVSLQVNCGNGNVNNNANFRWDIRAVNTTTIDGISGISGNGDVHFELPDEYSVMNESAFFGGADSSIYATSMRDDGNSNNGGGDNSDVDVENNSNFYGDGFSFDTDGDSKWMGL